MRVYEEVKHQRLYQMRVQKVAVEVEALILAFDNEALDREVG